MTRVHAFPFAFRLLLAAVVFCMLFSAPAHAAWWWPFGYKGMDYSISFEGVDKPTLQWFEKLKLDKRNQTHPPQNKQDLEQEAAQLSSRAKKALDAHGYYDATLTYDVTVSDKDKGHITVHIQPKSRYHVRSIKLEWLGKELAGVNPTFLVKPGDAVDADTILADVTPLHDLIESKYCLLSLKITPRLTLHRRKHEAELAYRIRHGAAANFGPTTVSGTERVKDSVVLNTLTWKQGSCYKEQQITDTRTALLQTQLFSSVNVRHGRRPDAHGEVPMTVDVNERDERTLSAGASYNTDEGATVTAGWEHRNLFGGAEKFDSNLSLAQKEQYLNNTLTIPYFLMDTKLVLTGNLKHENQDAYSASSLDTSASLQRALGKHLTGGAGVGYTIAHTNDVLAGSSDYALLSFPTFLTFDNRDNVLDSHKGFYLNAAVTPYTETFGDGGQFLKTLVTGQTYLSAPIAMSPTLALKASVGSINGSTGKNVPSDIRFYAGGGGSVRGYSYQSLGPRINGTAVGGASLLVGSAEARLRFNDTFGGVAFVDAGNVYAESTPNLDRKLYYGAGVGVRYSTPIGPLRADIAVPLNGHDIGATGYAIYVSIGQSF